MVAFRDTLEDCDLNDLGCSWQWFTWERGRLPKNNIRERLDRGVTNFAWWELFPRYLVANLSHSFSDHCPVLVDTGQGRNERLLQGDIPFRFDTNWILEEDFEDQVKKRWDASGEELLNKLVDFGKSLKE
ncbi:uncharacterized protein [Gossypium hirsutum]|uniref:Reverse transcriptase n=1 Tax=Gossypium hirsutum TaxID=3635 RepID=A0ABM3AZG3_GOSHI|nr:uncharacterized protein LOC121223166 [Gossypium hirsutum]